MNTMTRYTVAAAMLAALATTGCQDQQNGTSPWVGRQRTDSGTARHDDALEPMTDEIQPETYVAAGRLHESHHRLARAAQQYRLAIELDPVNIEAHSRLGIVLDRLGRYGEADESFHRAIELAPDKAFLYNNLGFSYTLQQRWAEAEEVFRRALEIQPDFARARVNLGMCLAHLDRWTEALHAFELAIPREDAYYNLGLLYQTRRQFVNAASAYRTALVLNPDFSAAQKRFQMLPPDVRDKSEVFHLVAGAPVETFTGPDDSFASIQPTDTGAEFAAEPDLRPTAPGDDQPEQVLSARPTRIDDPEPAFDPLGEASASVTEPDVADDNAYTMIAPAEQPVEPSIDEEQHEPSPADSNDWTPDNTWEGDTESTEIRAPVAYQPAYDDVDRDCDDSTAGKIDTASPSDGDLFSQKYEQPETIQEPAPEYVSPWQIRYWDDEVLTVDDLAAFFDWFDPWAIDFDATSPCELPGNSEPEIIVDLQPDIEGPDIEEPDAPADTGDAAELAYGPPYVPRN